MPSCPLARCRGEARDQSGYGKIEDIPWEYVERAAVAIDGPNYPLFEDMLGRLVDEAVREGTDSAFSLCGA